MATVTHNGMTYYIVQMDDGYDVRDVAGSRPAGLRASGPWKSVKDAEVAVLAMSPVECQE